MNQTLKPKTRKEIAQELGISYSTFWRWLKKNKIQLPKGLIFPCDQNKIHEKLYGKSLKKPEYE